MSNNSRLALVTVFILGAASAAMATSAFAANNYDSSDWAPMYSGPIVGTEPKASIDTRNTGRFIPGPRWQLSHRTDRPR
jgi:hypothetical protein